MRMWEDHRGGTNTREGTAPCHVYLFLFSFCHDGESLRFYEDRTEVFNCVLFKTHNLGYNENTSANCILLYIVTVKQYYMDETILIGCHFISSANLYIRTVLLIGTVITPKP